MPVPLTAMPIWRPSVLETVTLAEFVVVVELTSALPAPLLLISVPMVNTDEAVGAAVGAGLTVKALLPVIAVRYVPGAQLVPVTAAPTWRPSDWMVSVPPSVIAVPAFEGAAVA